VWTLPITLENNDQRLSTLTRDGNFGDAAALLGTAHDTEGVLVVSGINVLVRIWSSAGIRIAGRCNNTCVSNPNGAGIDSITLSPPFLGRDAGAGIGSTRAELEADIGAGNNNGAADSNGVVVYGDEDPLGFGDPALGVVYAQDGQCEERAVGLLFNYANPN
jgi:hypothetical protein